METNTKMTTNRKSLIADAKAAGFKVDDQGSRLVIARWSKHVTPRVLRGVAIYNDGTAFDLTVVLHVAKGMRSYVVIRKALGL